MSTTLPVAKIRDWRQLATVTVTYHHDLEVLRRQLAALPLDCHKVVVDNNSSAEAVNAIKQLTNTIPNIHLLANTTNLGLAAAINEGARLATNRFPEVRYCLLLDHDSEPQPDSVPRLLDAFEDLERENIGVGCVGPLLVDAVTDLPHGFHQPTHWRWRRVYPVPGSPRPVPCTNLNGSGTLVPLDLFLRLGGLDEGLFIDHVDTEWAFRVLAHGYTLWGVPQAVFKHRMGGGSLRYWLLGWRVWPARSALRHRYLFRNALWLMRRPYVPGVWKFWAMVKLALTFTVHALFDPQRGAQLRAMLQGLGEGLRKGSAPP